MEIIIMSNTNVLVITGYLESDAICRSPESTGNGETENIAVISLVVNKQLYETNGECVTTTSWVPVKMFGKVAKDASTLSKGNTITITGELAQDHWIDKFERKRNRLYVCCTSFEPSVSSQRADEGISNSQSGSKSESCTGARQKKRQSGNSSVPMVNSRPVGYRS